MAERPSSDDLRQLVREVLREALGEYGAAGRGQKATLAEALGRAARGGETALTVSSDRELAELVRAAAVVSENDGLAQAVDSGRLKLSLGQQARQAQGTPATSSGSAPRRNSSSAAAPTKQPVHIDKGVISETRIAALAKEHSKLVLGKAAVLTPLAKDRARELNLVVERGRS